MLEVQNLIFGYDKDNPVLRGVEMTQAVADALTFLLALPFAIREWSVNS